MKKTAFYFGLPYIIFGIFCFSFIDESKGQNAPKKDIQQADSSKQLQKPMTGEPVPGAEIYVELEPDDEPIANVITNDDGEFSFVIPPNLPASGNFVFVIQVTKPLARKYKLNPDEKIRIRVPFQKPSRKITTMKYQLIWRKDRAENKGAFAVSGKNST